MILLCDEDIGTKVPRALNLVGRRTISLDTKGWLGYSDIKWLTEVGKRKWLAFSCNKKMLKVPVERDTIIREKAGIVFLTSGEEYLPHTLRLLLTKWGWLEQIDRLTPRPFAYYLYPNGQTRLVLESTRPLFT